MSFSDPVAIAFFLCIAVCVAIIYKNHIKVRVGDIAMDADDDPVEKINDNSAKKEESNKLPKE